MNTVTLPRSPPITIAALGRAGSGWISVLAASGPSFGLEVIPCRTPLAIRALFDARYEVVAVAIDARTVSPNRDFLMEVSRHRAVAIVVEGATGQPIDLTWEHLGAHGRVDPADPLWIDRFVSLATIGTHATPAVQPHLDETPGRLGRLVAVVGVGGAWAAPLAVAAAQRLGGPGSCADRGTLLADLTRSGHHRVHHGVPGDTPGLLELVAACRMGRPAQPSVEQLLVSPPGRRYRFLPGMRHPLDWMLLGPASAEAALRAIRSVADLAVVEVDADLEAEQQTGSLDLADRHCLAHDAFTSADLIVISTTPSCGRLRQVEHLLAVLGALEVPSERIRVAITGAPRLPGVRRAIGRVLADAGSTTPPLFVPLFEHDTIGRTEGRLPLAAVRATAKRLAGALQLVDARSSIESATEGTLIIPGELGHWIDEPEAAPCGQTPWPVTDRAPFDRRA